MSLFKKKTILFTFSASFGKFGLHLMPTSGYTGLARTENVRNEEDDDYVKQI